MIAASRPQARGGSPGIQNIGPTSVKATTTEGYAPLGQAFGKGLGDVLGDMFDPDKVRERAKQTRELVLKMPPELQKMVASNPDVQERFRHYYRMAPELFADAGAVLKDPNMKGLITFAPDTFLAEELATKQAQRYKIEEETRKTQAEIPEVEERTKLIQAQTQEETEMLPVKKKYYEAQTKSIEEGASDRARKLELAEEAQRLREARLGQQEEALRMQRERLLNEQRRIEETKTERNARRTFQYYHEQTNMLRESAKRNFMRDDEFFEQHANIVRSQLVDPLGKTLATTSDGSKVYVPAAMGDPHAAGAVNRALEDLYLSFLSLEQKGKSEANVRRLISLARTADRLWSDTYKPFTSINLSPDDKVVYHSYLSPRLIGSTLYMRMKARELEGSLTPEMKAEYLKKIEEYGVPLPYEPTPWYRKVYEFFSNPSTSEPSGEQIEYNP